MELQNINRILQLEICAHSNGHSMPQVAIVEHQVSGAIFFFLNSLQ